MKTGMRRGLCAMLALVMLLLAGCGGRNVAGKYSSNRGIELELNEDKTGRIKLSLTGDWYEAVYAVNGNKIFVTWTYTDDSGSEQKEEKSFLITDGDRLLSDDQHVLMKNKNSGK